MAAVTVTNDTISRRPTGATGYWGEPGARDGLLPALRLDVHAAFVGAAVRYVSIPAFSRLAEEEDDTLARGVQQALPMLVTFVAPVAMVMVTLSPALIEVLYGAHWVPAAAALQFLSFVMVARMVTALVFDIQTGLGNTKVTIGLKMTALFQPPPPRRTRKAVSRAPVTRKPRTGMTSTIATIEARSEGMKGSFDHRSRGGSAAISSGPSSGTRTSSSSGLANHP